MLILAKKQLHIIEINVIKFRLCRRCSTFKKHKQGYLNKINRFMKILTISFFLIIYSNLFSQELISNKYMKGSYQNGKKVSKWEYFNKNGELVIKIDHNSGKLFF